jgi:hypothetical protein
MNQVLIEHLDPAAWRAKPPGKARTIAAIFGAKWVRLTAPHLKVPAQLNRVRCTMQAPRAGLAESAARCAEMLAEALGDSGDRVDKFCRDGWARLWLGKAVERVQLVRRPRLKQDGPRNHNLLASVARGPKKNPITNVLLAAPNGAASFHFGFGFHALPFHLTHSQRGGKTAKVIL